MVETEAKSRTLPVVRSPLCLIGTVVFALVLSSAVPAGRASDAVTVHDPGRASTVILISLDGTTFEQIQRAELETIRSLMKRGSAASRLIPAFPTNTFPNHVTLVTGVLPARHGIVNNTFRDPGRGLYRKSDDPSWILSEPIWSIADRHGVVSASFHWVGSEGRWSNGYGPRHWVKFDADTRERTKVDQILAWLDLEDPDLRPRLITAWFHGSDRTGHRWGPDDEAVSVSLRGQDAALRRLVEGLEERAAFPNTTLLLVSDHGMEAVSSHVDLIHALRAADVDAEVLGGGGFATVWTNGDGERAKRVVDVARSLGLEAYLRREAPADLGVDAPRFGDVVVLAPPGTSIGRRISLERFTRGMHGYRPEIPSMGAILIAAGRGVQPGTHLGQVRNLDVAPTVLELLGIPVPEWMDGRPLAKLVPSGQAIVR